MTTSAIVELLTEIRDLLVKISHDRDQAADEVREAQTVVGASICEALLDSFREGSRLGREQFLGRGHIDHDVSPSSVAGPPNARPEAASASVAQTDPSLAEEMARLRKELRAHTETLRRMSDHFDRTAKAGRSKAVR